MWPCHQRGTRGVWRLHAAVQGLPPAGLGPRRGAALGGSLRGGYAVCPVLEGEGAGVFLGLRVQPLHPPSQEPRPGSSRGAGVTLEGPGSGVEAGLGPRQ